VPDCRIVIADNVAQYYADTSKQDWTLNSKNFPCIAPPFETIWFIEWQEPGYVIGEKGIARRTGGRHVQGGAFFMNMPIDKAKDLCTEALMPAPDLERLFNLARWFLVVQYCVATDNGQVWYLPTMHGVFVSPDGAYLESFSLSECVDPSIATGRKLADAWQALLHVPLLTLGFLQCKNVTRLDVSNTEGPSPKWCRRQRVPELKYHALQIDPSVGSRPAGARKTKGDRSGKALHICRGHFSHFVDDGVSQGLFGRRQFGTFWVPAHTRGSADLGKVVSTYNVQVPA